jgi:hypothetical protein
MNSKFVIVPIIIIIASIFVVVAIDFENLDKICAEKGEKRNGDVCFIEIEATSVEETVFDFSQISLMRSNSMEYFYYPNPKDTENRDAFQKFILIRLSEELGGLDLHYLHSSFLHM